jgi:two-component system copper resistance phosphate regulon response regulator CusR
MRLLVVEDEAKTARYLQRGFTESGFAVDTASDGGTGLHLTQTCDYALVILDIMLPRLDGWAVLRELRRSGRETAVIILSARDSVEDRVKGLELGADDYLIKPFAFSELLARVRTVLRRGTARQLDTIQIGDLEIDVAKQRVSRAGVAIRLTAKEFTLLVLLARRTGEVLSRTFITEQVWDLNFDSDTNVVEVLMRRLRSKIDDPFDAKLIHTQRGQGYVLEKR